jgi:hypothetical protein
VFRIAQSTLETSLSGTRHFNVVIEELAGQSAPFAADQDKCSSDPDTRGSIIASTVKWPVCSACFKRRRREVEYLEPELVRQRAVVVVSHRGSAMSMTAVSG